MKLQIVSVPKIFLLRPYPTLPSAIALAGHHVPFVCRASNFHQKYCVYSGIQRDRSVSARSQPRTTAVRTVSSWCMMSQMEVRFLDSRVITTRRLSVFSTAQRRSRTSRAGYKRSSGMPRKT